MIVKRSMKIGTIVVIGMGAWFLTRKREAAAEPKREAADEDPLLGPPALDPRYTYNPSPDEIVAAYAAAAAIGPTAVQTMIEIEAERQRQALGITEAEVETYQDFALRVNTELGGSYVNGVLTPPAWWTGSVTEWSRYVQSEAYVRWQKL